MPLNSHNSKTFHRCLYAGILKNCTLLKRGDDQREGTVTAYVLFQCRRTAISQRGQPIQGSMAVGHRTDWILPRCEIERIGIPVYFNNLDRIVEDHSDFNVALPPESWRYWQPESTTDFDYLLFQNYITLTCLRIDPPKLPQVYPPQ